MRKIISLSVTGLLMLLAVTDSLVLSLRRSSSRSCRILTCRGAHDVAAPGDNLSPRKQRLSKNKAAAKKRVAAPGLVSSSPRASSELLDPAFDAAVATHEELINAIKCYEVAGAPRKMATVVEAAGERGVIAADGGDVLRVAIMGLLRLGRPDVAKEALENWGVMAFAALAAEPEPTLRLLKALCQNGLVVSASSMARTFGLYESGLTATATQLPSSSLPALSEWGSSDLALLHAALARGFIKVGKWKEARTCLRAWKAQGCQLSFSSSSFLVPTEVANSILRAAAKGRHLPTLLEALETLGAVGCTADDTTHEVSGVGWRGFVRRLAVTYSDGRNEVVFYR